MALDEVNSTSTSIFSQFKNQELEQPYGRNNESRLEQIIKSEQIKMPNTNLKTHVSQFNEAEFKQQNSMQQMAEVTPVPESVQMQESMHAQVQMED